MNESFDGSFKIYMEPENTPQPGAAEPVRPEEPYSLKMFSMEVDNVKGDLVNLENMYNRLQESNEEIKIAQNASAMRELRSRLNMDLENLSKLVKQINRKYDGLVRANAAQRKVNENGPGSGDDQVRASMISQLVENIQFMMRKFQGLRAQMESDHRQLIETKYYAITREKATAEAIDNLMASEVPEGPLQLAMQEFGRGPVMEAVAEIQERRDTMREVRRNLMALHQVLLGIATPVVAPPPAEGGSKAGGLPSPVEKYPAPAPTAGGFGPVKGGTGGLNDYERETRKQAYIAIAIALGIIIVLIVVLLKVESDLENAPET